MNMMGLLMAAGIIGAIGIIIGVLLGLASEKLKVEVDEKEILVRAELPGNNCGVLMLTTGKADALAVSYDNGEMLMKSYPEIAMTEFKFDHSDEGNVIAVKKGEDELLEALNGIIAEVNESGLYSQWTEEARALAESLGIEMK